MPPAVGAVALTMVCLGCVTAQGRLEPESLAAVRSTKVQSVVTAPALSVQFEPSPGPPLLAWAKERGEAELASARAEPLRTATMDLDFPEQYSAGLKRTVTGVAWLRATDFEKVVGEAPAPGAGGSNGQSLLRVETTQMLSPDLCVLEIRSVFDFFKSAESTTQSARIVTIYRSEPIGDVADKDAIALWVAQGAKAYRAEVAQAITESLKLARRALDTMEGTEKPGPEVELWAILMRGRPVLASRLNAFHLVGTVVEETAQRLVVRQGSAYYSLPTSAIRNRQVPESN